MEIWKDIFYTDNKTNDIIDYNGLYKISNYGNIKNKNGKIMKQAKDKDGYKIVCLTKNKKHKNFRVHRLVAFMFIENDNLKEKIYINHKDENKENNHMNNLEWCTSKYNINYGTGRERSIDTLKKTLSNKDLTGNNNPFYGNQHTDEWKNKKIKELSKPIIQYDKNNNIIKEWINAREASRELDINYSHISSCCIYYKYGDTWWEQNRKGRPCKTYKGFIWKFKD